MKGSQGRVARLLMKGSLTVLLVACVFDLASSFTLWRLERSFVDSIRLCITSTGSFVEQVEEATHKVHEISKDRIGLLRRSEPQGWIAPRLTPSLAMGMFGEGACGYISFLEIEVLEAMEFDARPVQILGVDGLNRHVIVEATSGCDTVFVDPLFDWVYIDKAGRPVSRKELETNWSNLVQKAPLDGVLRYPIEYGMRYTNWNALGRIGVFAKLTMTAVYGEEQTQAFSFRAMMPDYYLMRITLVVILGLLIFVKLQRQFANESD